MERRRLSRHTPPPMPRLRIQRSSPIDFAPLADALGVFHGAYADGSIVLRTRTPEGYQGLHTVPHGQINHVLRED